MKHWEKPELRRESQQSDAPLQKQDTPSISSSNFRSPRLKRNSPKQAAARNSGSKDSYKSLSSSSSYRSDVSFKLWPDDDKKGKRKRSSSHTPPQNKRAK